MFKEIMSYLFLGIVVGAMGMFLSLLCGSNKLAIAYSIGAGISIAMTPLWKRLFLDNSNNGEVTQSQEVKTQKPKTE